MLLGEMRVTRKCPVIDDNKLWDLKKQKFIYMKPSRLFWSYAVTAANITNGENWSRKQTKSTASWRISISSGLCINNVTCENTHMSNCEETVGKYYGHLLSDQLIVFVEMQKFQRQCFAKINNSHGVVIKLWCLQILCMTLHYQYCMTVNNIIVPY